MNIEQDKIPSKYEFWDVKGIDRVLITLEPNSKMNVFIGNNGVGKTKTLECLYQALLFSSNKYQLDGHLSLTNKLVFGKAKIDENDFMTGNTKVIKNVTKTTSYPIIYIPSQKRGYFKNENIDFIKPLGEYKERQQSYFRAIYKDINNYDYNDSIETWFIQRAQSANRYQDDEDNREVELLSVLNILHKIDERISNTPSSLNILGGKSVSLMIAGKKRKLGELSSGFASLVKIVQSIVSGYAFFTNSTNLENEKGVVLIDEIESHLHISWQTRILPILNEVFPNTIFIVATHSSLVLSQLYDGKAYELVNEDGVIKNKEIPNPSNEAFVDLLSTAFNVNLNEIKLDNIQPKRSVNQKNKLFDILELSK
ncbi:AAA family ATPase [Gallibacterium anatis]|uniref:ATPase AAA-type core domain-containing protein n=2 Tax=Gallibacterium anatis TaxID=750 RepID=U1H2I4_9PAST|nr:AAA family ATPase [Gallibacterium anatis]ERF78988.1 hypothetical protein N561_03335 [Gallibacterium anatis 12656/12]KGQ49529.1 hypothetical protein JL04_05360 [Gallibacterium anatis]KGQ61819.1 hypothetical protein IO48_06765 [Gallibacterium anatis 4895]